MAKPPKVFTVFDPPEDRGLDCSGDPGQTKQSFKEECDINVLMARYELTGELDPMMLNQREGVFGDFCDMQDFHEMQERLLAARESFGALPAAVRSRFGNDPGRLVDFLSDPENRSEAVRLGIVEEKASTPDPAGKVAQAGQPGVLPVPAGKSPEGSAPAAPVAQ